MSAAENPQRSPFAPDSDRAEATGGLQRNPDQPPWQPEAAAPEQPSPWQDDTSAMTPGAVARNHTAARRSLAQPVPRVPMSVAIFGHPVPTRVVAALAAAALALGGIGGLIGGWTGSQQRAQYRTIELQQVEGGAGDGSLTAIGEVAQKLRPAVVSISVSAGELAGVGSGFVIDGDGYILTNNHVISAVAERPDAEVTVTFFSAGGLKEVPAVIVGRDPKTDLAIVQVTNVEGLTVAQLGDSDAVNVGDTVVAVGSPQGLGGTVTAGIISAKNRPVRLQAEGTDTDGFADALQTDASINPGNSGGPLVDIRGAIVGINTVIFSNSGGSQGLGFAIPINFAVDIAEQLIAGETPHHPSLGVTARTVSNGALTGAEIATIIGGGAASSHGLREGDIITAIGQRQVASADELTVAVWSAGAGVPTPVTVVRGGVELVVEVTFD